MKTTVLPSYMLENAVYDLYISGQFAGEGLIPEDPVIQNALCAVDDAGVTKAGVTQEMLDQAHLFMRNLQARHVELQDQLPDVSAMLQPADGSLQELLLERSILEMLRDNEFSSIEDLLELARLGNQEAQAEISACIQSDPYLFYAVVNNEGENFDWHDRLLEALATRPIPDFVTKALKGCSVKLRDKEKEAKKQAVEALYNLVRYGHAEAFAILCSEIIRDVALVKPYFERLLTAEKAAPLFDEAVDKYVQLAVAGDKNALSILCFFLGMNSISHDRSLYIAESFFTAASNNIPLPVGRKLELAIESLVELKKLWTFFTVEMAYNVFPVRQLINNSDLLRILVFVDKLIQDFEEEDGVFLEQQMIMAEHGNLLSLFTLLKLAVTHDSVYVWLCERSDSDVVALTMLLLGLSDHVPLALNLVLKAALEDQVVTACLEKPELLAVVVQLRFCFFSDTRSTEYFSELFGQISKDDIEQFGLDKQIEPLLWLTALGNDVALGYVLELVFEEKDVEAQKGVISFLSYLQRNNSPLFLETLDVLIKTAPTKTVSCRLLTAFYLETQDEILREKLLTLITTCSDSRQQNLMIEQIYVLAQNGHHRLLKDKSKSFIKQKMEAVLVVLATNNQTADSYLQRLTQQSGSDSDASGSAIFLPWQNSGGEA